MDPRRFRRLALALAAALLLIDTPALAYIGPGAGFAVMGSFLAVICGGMEPRFEGVVSLYGGGDMQEIVKANLPWSSSLSREVVSRSLNPWIGPLDPSKFVGDVSPRPFLMVNGSRDTRIPKECVLELYKRAGDPKELIWLDTEHRIQDEADLMVEATGVVLEWLGEQGLLGEDRD